MPSSPDRTLIEVETHSGSEDSVPVTASGHYHSIGTNLSDMTGEQLGSWFESSASGDGGGSGNLEDELAVAGEKVSKEEKREAPSSSDSDDEVVYSDVEDSRSQRRRHAYTAEPNGSGSSSHYGDGSGASSSHAGFGENDLIDESGPSNRGDASVESDEAFVMGILHDEIKKVWSDKTISDERPGVVAMEGLTLIATIWGNYLYYVANVMSPLAIPMLLKQVAGALNWSYSTLSSMPMVTALANLLARRPSEVVKEFREEQFLTRTAGNPLPKATGLGFVSALPPASLRKDQIGGDTDATIVDQIKGTGLALLAMMILTVYSAYISLQKKTSELAYQTSESAYQKTVSFFKRHCPSLFGSFDEKMPDPELLSALNARNIARLTAAIDQKLKSNQAVGIQTLLEEGPSAIDAALKAMLIAPLHSPDQAEWSLTKILTILGVTGFIHNYGGNVGQWTDSTITVIMTKISSLFSAEDSDSTGVDSDVAEWVRSTITMQMSSLFSAEDNDSAGLDTNGDEQGDSPLKRWMIIGVASAFIFYLGKMLLSSVPKATPGVRRLVPSVAGDFYDTVQELLDGKVWLHTERTRAIIAEIPMYQSMPKLIATSAILTTLLGVFTVGTGGLNTWDNANNVDKYILGAFGLDKVIAPSFGIWSAIIATGSTMGLSYLFNTIFTRAWIEGDFIPRLMRLFTKDAYASLLLHMKSFVYEISQAPEGKEMLLLYDLSPEERTQFLEECKSSPSFWSKYLSWLLPGLFKVTQSEDIDSEGLDMLLKQIIEQRAQIEEAKIQKRAVQWLLNIGLRSEELQKICSEDDRKDWLKDFQTETDTKTGYAARKLPQYIDEFLADLSETFPGLTVQAIREAMSKEVPAPPPSSSFGFWNRCSAEAPPAEKLDTEAQKFLNATLEKIARERKDAVEWLLKQAAHYTSNDVMSRFDNNKDRYSSIEIHEFLIAHLESLDDNALTWIVTRITDNLGAMNSDVDPDLKSLPRALQWLQRYVEAEQQERFANDNEIVNDSSELMPTEQKLNCLFPLCPISGSEDGRGTYSRVAGGGDEDGQEMSNVVAEGPLPAQAPTSCFGRFTQWFYGERAVPADVERGMTLTII